MNRSMMITREHDYGNAYWIQPVRVSDVEYITSEQVRESSNEISIQADDFDSLLAYFFKQHFDGSQSYNQHRYSLDMNPTGRSDKFEYYLEHNFYTYQQMEDIIQEIESVADAFRGSVYDNITDELLAFVNGYFNVYFGLNKAVTYDMFKHKLCDFYQKFVSEVRRMMKECPECTLFDVMAP